MGRLSIPIIACVTAIVLWFGLHGFGQSNAVCWTAAITLFTAILWITEAIPIPAASLIPFAAFPLAGVLSHREAASALGSHVIILLMGAFMLSKGLEKSGVHKRFAVYMVKMTGTHSARRLVLGFMLTGALLSMWISNTATTLMLLPIALAVVQPLNNPRLVVAILLGTAYASSLGGVGTPIGTPPNIIFMSVYLETQGLEMSFTEWMKTGVPIVLLGIPVMALWLTRGLGPLNGLSIDSAGQWQSQEKRILIIFAVVAFAWIFRPFWTQWLGLTTVGDSTIALAGVLAMFLTPSGKSVTHLTVDGQKNEKLLDWQTASSIPWGMLLLFAGGICIAKAFTRSGLSEQLGQLLTGLAGFPVLLMLLLICLFVTFLTEITSNTATATLLMPILAAAGMAMGVDPKLLMIPAAISATCAFMLPVATAPNAVVYGTEKIPMKRMVREGIVLNILIAIIVTLVSYITL
jgi:sodium-dependent dicarboxylate transporter 2/3/5